MDVVGHDLPGVEPDTEEVDRYLAPPVIGDLPDRAWGELAMIDGPEDALSVTADDRHAIPTRPGVNPMFLAARFRSDSGS